MKKPALLIFLALMSVYFIWGSTYLAMRFAVQSIPPLLMASARYLLAGGLIFAALRWRGEPVPSWRQWRNGGVVGTFLLLGGNGSVCVALQHGAGSGLSALVLAITPLMVLAMGYGWGQRATGREWAGMLLGLAGMVVLSFGHDLRASPLAGALLLLAAASWSFGSLWGKHVDQPQGFMASAVQMLVGGAVLMLAALADGEHLHQLPDLRALIAFAYLVLFGAILGFSSYVYLLANVRPALAVSYSYVNPLVAVLLGVVLGGETVDAHEGWAMAVIIAGVVLVCLPRREPA